MEGYDFDLDSLELPELPQKRSKGPTQYQPDRQKIRDKLARNTAIIERYIQSGEEPPPALIGFNKGQHYDLIFPNELFVVQGRDGSFKSTFVEQIAALMLREGTIIPGMSFRKNSKQPVQVLYIDTERNIKFRSPAAMKRIIDIAGTREGFYFTSLYNVNRMHRLDALREILEQRAKNSDPKFIVLDIVTDCIADFNDLPETYRLIDLLVEFKDEYNATFCCVIHMNPGGDKARGHAGTELRNKASLVIQTNFNHDEQLGEIEFLKNSLTARPPILGFAFDEGVMIDSNLEGVSKGLQQKQWDIIEFVTDHDQWKLASEMMTRKELKELLSMENSPVSEGSAYRSIQKLIDRRVFMPVTGAPNTFQLHHEIKSQLK